MTVKELIEELKKIDDVSRLVVLQKDSEGNGYSPLSGAGESWYIADSTWSGECHHPEDIASGDVELGDDVKAVVLWPIN